MIRECDADDFASVFTIINDAAIAYKGIIPADRWKDPYMPEPELYKEIAAGVRFFGYEIDGRLQAVMGCQRVKDVTLIRHAYTRSVERGKGLGTQLLHHLCKTTSTPILIGTWRDADWAIRFYQGKGFLMVSDTEKTRLLKKYWDIPQRQIETSVVLANVPVPVAG